MALKRLLGEDGKAFWKDCSGLEGIHPHDKDPEISWLAFKGEPHGNLVVRGTPDEVFRAIRRSGMRGPVGGSRCTIVLSLQNDGPDADLGELSVDIDGPMRSQVEMRHLKQALEQALMEMQFSVVKIMTRREEPQTAPQQSSAP